jgi:hypothetical protein
MKKRKWEGLGGLERRNTQQDMGGGDGMTQGRSDTMQVAWLGEVLETVREFGAASLGLVAWELSLAEEDLAPAWSYAILNGLLRPVGAGMHAAAGDEAETPYTLAREIRPATPFPAPDGSR